MFFSFLPLTLARLWEVGKTLIDAGYGNLAYFSAGRWLGDGNLLERWNFLSCFLRSRALRLLETQFIGSQRLTRLYFLTDERRHMSTFNLKLQREKPRLVGIVKDV